ncbi:hypothetical protein ACFVWY_33940 [Streptomyces sp. NPDC058195]|uniref:hypothetical protein n=1 Tax=Streptomyces sp. NPDC058195 TaxID=3346375 RepID=UPI0036E623C4
MSARTAYLAVASSASALVIGLTILITSMAMDDSVGPSLVTGAITAAIGAVAAAVTGIRAARAYATYRVAQADSAALALAIVRHDTTLTAPPESVVAFERRTPRETAT